MKTYPVYLNGEWVISKPYPVVNPATGEPFAEMSSVERERVAQALETAAAAFGQWRDLTGKARGELLRRIASELEGRREELARTITQENGKPLAQSVAEVSMTIDHFQWFAEEARRGYGRVIPHQVESKRHLAIKSPVGVVAAITPWNFPLVLGARKIAPALAAGCPVILKPARQTPLCCVALAECIAAAQAPKGVFQLVTGSASEIGHEFLHNPLCRKITFTGSTEVGKRLIQGAAESVKRLSLELGGHAPVLVFEDAPLETAVEGAMLTKFRNSGQSCIAANRIYIQRSIYQRFTELFVAKTKRLVAGNGLDPATQIGPLIDKPALDKAARHVQNALASGARLLCGGDRVPERSGFFFQATVLADVPSTALCMKEETFGPIAPLCPFESETEAIQLANASNYGLSAYVFTRDLGRAFRVMEALEAGTIAINDSVPATSQSPFGGMKQSGWGRELGIEGMEAFQEIKHISLGLG